MADIRFPLYRIPFLALCIILNFYSLHDIIQLSLCSKRSLQVAKKCWKKKGLVKTELSVKRIPSITLYYINDLSYEFSISRTRYLQGEWPHNIRVGDAVIPSVHKDDETVTFWEDKSSGIQHIVRYIKELFDVPIHSINLGSEEHPNEFNGIMDYIMSTQETITHCTLNHVRSIDECLTHLLDNCKITGNLWIFGELSTQFSHHWNINTDDLLISYGRCITSQNLMNINCRFLKLGDSSLTGEDLNQFLKHWQNGGNARLKFLSIMKNSVDQETITSGIDTVLRIVFRYYRGMDKKKVRKFGGLDIRRNDGATGTIFFSDDKFEFGVGLTEYRP